MKTNDVVQELDNQLDIYMESMKEFQANLKLNNYGKGTDMSEGIRVLVQNYARQKRKIMEYREYAQNLIKQSASSKQGETNE